MIGDGDRILLAEEEKSNPGLFTSLLTTLCPLIATDEADMSPFSHMNKK